MILRIIPNGESNADIIFFSKELGKITARAQSVRKLESTMRMHLMRYSHVMIDLVRGKNTWRLTGIATIDRWKAGSLFEVMHKIVRLVEFLVRGEESHTELFIFLVNFFHFLESISGRIESESHLFREGVEITGVITLLYELGYWNHDHFSPKLSIENIHYARDHKKELVQQINQALEATQLT